MAGISCIRPCAPAGLVARGLKPDSCLATAASRSARDAVLLRRGLEQRRRTACPRRPGRGRRPELTELTVGVGEDPADRGRRLVDRLDPDVLAGARGLDHLVVADVDRDVVHRGAEGQDVAGLRVGEPALDRAAGLGLLVGDARAAS